MPSGQPTIFGVPISHPEKLLWPADGITKLELARYYERVAPILLRYARHRPLTLRPFPRGVDQPGFYLHDAPKGRPAWLASICATTACGSCRTRSVVSVS